MYFPPPSPPPSLPHIPSLSQNAHLPSVPPSLPPSFQSAAALLLSALDEVAWLYNIRGSDIQYNPVVYAYSVVTDQEAVLFINGEKLGEDVKEVRLALFSPFLPHSHSVIYTYPPLALPPSLPQHLAAAGVTVLPYTAITTYLKESLLPSLQAQEGPHALSYFLSPSLPPSFPPFSVDFFEKECLPFVYRLPLSLPPPLPPSLPPSPPSLDDTPKDTPPPPPPQQQQAQATTRKKKVVMMDPNQVSLALGSLIPTEVGREGEGKGREGAEGLSPGQLIHPPESTHF